MNMDQVVMGFKMPPGDENKGGYEKLQKPSEKGELPLFVALSLLNPVNIYPSNVFEAVLALLPERKDIDMIAPPGKRLSVAPDPAIRLVKAIRKHGHPTGFPLFSIWRFRDVVFCSIHHKGSTTK
jgi:hypothetical protein